MNCVHISLEGQRSYDLFRKKLLPDGFAGLKQLKYLSISDCRTEECLANAPATTIVFPVLEELYFFGPFGLREICRGPVPQGSFGKLTSIRIRDCYSLEYLFPLQILGCLTQLKRLTIQHCPNMKEVIWKEQGDTHIAANGIEFRNLEFLHLEDLPSLVGFCTGIDQIDFPKLRCMHLEEFSKHLFDIKSSLSSNSEQNFDVGKQISDSPNASSIFPQKVTFPCLEDLSLKCLRFKGYSELQISPFLTVKKLVLTFCSSLRYVCSSSMARHLVHLKELNISNCSEMYAVVDWEEEIEDGQERKVDTTLFPQLSKLQLNDLSNLRSLCRGPVPGGFFGELTSVEIRYCDSLEYLFPLQIVGCLTQLKCLTIKSCTNMKEVIQKEQEGAHIATNGIEFRNLEFLHLGYLTNLVGFCTGIDQIDFPKLICMRLEDLPKRLFDIKSSLSSNSEQNFDVGKQISDNPNASSIFPQKVTFPCLEDLSLQWLRYSELQISPFLTVKKLVVSYCYNLRYVFHSSVARHLVHLEELNISNCSEMDAVVDWEEEIEDGQERKVDTTLFSQLSKLQLGDLSNLTRLCRGPVPGGSFGELTSIEISRCYNLRYVFNSSMARHLVHLKELNISNCSKMDAVVDWEEEIEDGQERKVDTTLFPQLSKLQLNGLSNLTRLCRGPVPGGSFGELTSIEISGCNNLRYVFNFSMARHLVHLKELNISNCSKMDAVVDWEEEIEDGQKRKVDTTLFPQLSKLQLNGLRNLTWLCRGISWNGVPNPNIPWNGDLNNALRLLQEREKAERERFVVVEEDLKKQHRVADDDIHDEDDLKKRRRVADDDIHDEDDLKKRPRVADQGKPHSIQASKIYEPAPDIEHENVRDGDRHEHLEDSYKMEVDNYESDRSIERNNNMIPWRETLPPNPQRGRCICFRTADLYTDTSVITRFYSVPFDLFGDGGDDNASSSKPDVEGLEPFYKCTDFATTSTLSSVGSSLFVVGGSKETGPCRVSITTEKMYRFDTAAPENDWYKWDELSMQTPRAFPITVAMDGKLYIFGGSDPESPDAPLAELFDPESSTSVPLPLPSGFPINAWCHLVVAALQPSKKILVASGLSSDAYEYNVVDQGWEKLDYEVDFSSVQGQAAVVQNGNVLCWCSNNVDEVHAYHLVHKRWFKSPIKGLDRVGMRDPDGLAHYCPIFPLDDNHLCLLWKDHMGYDGTNLPLLHCVKIQVSIDPQRSRFDAVVVASRTYALGPDESIFDAHVFLREDDEGGERGSGWGGHENGGRTWERSGYGGGKRTVSSIAPFKTCSKCWGTGHTESSCDQVGSDAGT